jgi:endonuclease/exonuclease/phosphatase family metal-dependent hydrolase
MHLDPWEEANRLSQAAQVNELPVEEGAQAILAGDMNSRPDTEVFKLFGSHWVDATTAGQSTLPMPDGRPRFRGDYVLVRKTACLRPIESDVIDDRIASDHRPVLVVLEWTAACFH